MRGHLRNILNIVAYLVPTYCSSLPGTYLLSSCDVSLRPFIRMRCLPEMSSRFVEKTALCECECRCMQVPSELIRLLRTMMIALWLRLDLAT